MRQFRFKIFGIQGHQQLAAVHSLTFLHGNGFNKGREWGLDDTRFNRLDLAVGSNPGDQILAHRVHCSDRYGSIPSFARREQEDQHAKTQQNQD